MKNNNKEMRKNKRCDRQNKETENQIRLKRDHEKEKIIRSIYEKFRKLNNFSFINAVVMIMINIFIAGSILIIHNHIVIMIGNAINTILLILALGIKAKINNYVFQIISFYSSRDNERISSLTGKIDKIYEFIKKNSENNNVINKEGNDNDR